MLSLNPLSFLVANALSSGSVRYWSFFAVLFLLSNNSLFLKASHCLGCLIQFGVQVAALLKSKPWLATLSKRKDKT
jgi:hypothetical protein